MMPKTYSVDLRRRVVRFVEQGHSCREAARVFDLSPSFVIILMRRYRLTGELAGSPRGGARHDSLSRHLQVLVEWIKVEPGLTLTEMAKRLEMQLGVRSTESGLSKLLRRSGFTYKKIHAGQRGRAWQASKTQA